MHRILISARALTVLWALFWTGLGLVFAVGEGLRDGLVSMVMHAVPGLVFSALAFIAWRWEGPGGILLLLVGSCVPIIFRRIPQPLIVAMAAPPLAAGVLLLIHWRIPKLHDQR